MSNKQEDKDYNNLEKIRNDLFDYRVDIKSYIKNLNTIIIAASIIISVLAFFGYNKIENIEKIVLEKANQRLALTDSLLAKIDQKRIDSINMVLTSKEKEYETTINNFEKAIQQSRELELILLKNLPENESIKEKNVTYTIGNPKGLFEVIIKKRKLGKGQKEFIYLIFQENTSFGKSDFISVSLSPKGRNIITFQKYYKLNSKLNKVSFTLVPYKNYRKYNLSVSYYKKDAKYYTNYKINTEIELK